MPINAKLAQDIEASFLLKECVYWVVTCEHYGDLQNVIHKLSGHPQLIHANDNSGNYDDHKPPGEGNIDCKRLLTELSQIEFHGGFILELSGNKEPEIVLAEARGARRYLREISRQLALSSPPTVNVATGLHPGRRLCAAAVAVAG